MSREKCDPYLANRVPQLGIIEKLKRGAAAFLARFRSGLGLGVGFVRSLRQQQPRLHGSIDGWMFQVMHELLACHNVGTNK